MKTNSPIKSESFPIDIYWDLMSDIEFMKPYMDDPDIFNPESDKLRSFLIQAFCYLHSDFHYLSFLNNEDIESEILKAAGIFQIFPSNSINKKNKLFDDMSKDDIHKFWLKFFSLFKKQDDFSTDSLFNNEWVNKISFFKDMRNTSNYLNYQFPIVKGSKFIDVNAELENWVALKDGTVVTPDESGCLTFDENQTYKVDIDNLSTDLQQVVTMFRTKKLVSQENKLRHLDFFTNFINLTKNILHYKSNLVVVSSNFLDLDNCKVLFNNESISEGVYFIKRCINNVKTLMSEMKTLK